MKTVLHDNFPLLTQFFFLKGYLVNTTKDSILGKRKADIPLAYEDEFVASVWISARDNGGLKYARKSFYRDVKLWEHMFREYHKDAYDGLSREAGIIENFTNELAKKFGHYDRNTLRSFSMVRHMARLKSLQRHLAGIEETYRSKTKRIEFASS